MIFLMMNGNRMKDVVCCKCNYYDVSGEEHKSFRN